MHAFESFYTKSKTAIGADVRKFMANDFFTRYPELKSTVSFVIVGSVATATYDQYSDIDLDVLCARQSDIPDLLKKIKAYKKDIRSRDIPMQIHAPRTYRSVVDALQTWEHDGMLREYSQAVIVHDPKHAFGTIQKKFRWYPRVVLREKMRWLFAEAMFEFHERLTVAVKRNDVFFSETVKLKVIKYLMNLALLADHRFPAFDKHVSRELLKVKTLPHEFAKIIRRFAG